MKELFHALANREHRAVIPERRWIAWLAWLPVWGHFLDLRERSADWDRAHRFCWGEERDSNNWGDWGNWNLCVRIERALQREREKQNKTNKGKPKLNKTPEICLRVLSFWLNTNLCFHNAKLCEVRKRTNAGKFK